MSEFYPHRSALYMPGSNERALEKAKSLSADLFIFDMEVTILISGYGGIIQILELTHDPLLVVKNAKCLQKETILFGKVEKKEFPEK